MAVVHAHAEDTLPFGLIVDAAAAGDPFRQFHRRQSAGVGYPQEIRRHQSPGHQYGAGPRSGEMPGAGNVALMRGHGFASAARSIIEVVRLSVYLPRNARVQMNAMRMGGKPKPLSKGEIAARAAGYKPHSPETWRAWEYWANRAGCGDMIGEPGRKVDKGPHDH